MSAFSSAKGCIGPMVAFGSSNARFDRDERSVA